MTTTGKWWVIRHTHYAGKWWTGSDWSARKPEHAEIYTDEERQAATLPKYGAWEEC